MSNVYAHLKELARRMRTIEHVLLKQENDGQTIPKSVNDMLQEICQIADFMSKKYERGAITQYEVAILDDIIGDLEKEVGIK